MSLLGVKRTSGEALQRPLLTQNGHEKKSVSRGSGPAYAVAADPNARSQAIRELLCITAFFALQNSTRVGCSLLTHLRSLEPQSRQPTLDLPYAEMETCHEREVFRR